ncbi:MAG: hypothetical protein HFG00_12390 [Oscillibacter sp.]|nr:hypothetical protein [Oscillibacter sp.]
MTYAESNSGALCAANISSSQDLVGPVQVSSPFGTVYGGSSLTVGTRADEEAYPESSSYATFSNGEGHKITGMHSMASGANHKVTGMYSLALGGACTAAGNASLCGGLRCTITGGSNSISFGQSSTVNGHAGFAFGHGLTASNYQMVVGVHNVPHTNSLAYANGSKFIVGCGTTDSSKANAFRVTSSGVFASGSYNSSGADYAELFRWTDGNPDQEDRAGRFVTLEGEHIRLAGPEDRYILGIVSGNPSVVGNVYDDQWQGMFLRDVFGRLLYEDVEVPETLSPDGKVLQPARTERRPKLNPDYDPAQVYVPRSARPEWAAVGLLGKLAAVDDGSCPVNGWARVGADGTATASEEETRFRVMARLDETHVQIMML